MSGFDLILGIIIVLVVVAGYHEVRRLIGSVQAERAWRSWAQAHPGALANAAQEDGAQRVRTVRRAVELMASERISLEGVERVERELAPLFRGLTQDSVRGQEAYAQKLLEQGTA